MERNYQAPSIPSAFIWRRLHSLTGFWLALFLIEHLLTNSQAALFIGDDGGGFVHAVNWIKSLPYLPVIELTLLGVPILIHMMWGIVYLRTSKLNAHLTDGSSPALKQYRRNRAYSWQRITSWVLVFALIGHIIQMRFIEYPNSATKGGTKNYMVRLDYDEGLPTLSARLGFTYFDQSQIEEQKADLLGGFTKGILTESRLEAFWDSLGDIWNRGDSVIPSASIAKEKIREQAKLEQRAWINALEKRPLSEGQVVAVAPDFGTAELLMVRETFKMPLMLLLYTLFVLSACYHAYNGLWTFCISWGLTLTEKSQRLMRYVSVSLIVLISFLGLAAIWGTYWVNLRY